MLGFIERLKRIRMEKKQQTEDDCSTCLNLLLEAQRGNSRMFSDELEFVDPAASKQWEDQARKLCAELSESKTRSLRKAERYRELVSQRELLLKILNQNSRKLEQHNAYAAEARIGQAYRMIGSVEGRTLDRQQMKCIVKQVHNHLVLAGAGTGKTTTVVGKIKYLLATGQYRPEEILVLSFTNASAAEMRERIQKETGMPIEASTFHKLGIRIISQVRGAAPKITSLNLRKFIRQQILENAENLSYRTALIQYLLFFKVQEKSEFDFETAAEYREYLRLNPPITLKREKVKSYGEMEIANFLAFNGIQYEYERAYEQDTRTEEYGQYYPDFYLPEYHIYIEYFGINRQKQVPKYFSGKNGRSNTETYLEGMKWKRKIHRENGTQMIECFAYEKLEGNLQEKLSRKLEAHGVKLNPQAGEELWKNTENGSELDGLTELFETVINLMKSGGETVETLRSRIPRDISLHRNLVLLTLLKPVFEGYSQYLREHGEIDFNDMISLAAGYLDSGDYQSPYRYVIVDEYQDISKARYRLLKSLRASRDYDLFCVGDDWQSIYRFAGSDIGFILNFSGYWGETEVSKIETTYRFSSSMIAVSGKFIMQNPNQKVKNIRGVSDEGGFALEEICGYTAQTAVRFMEERLDALPEKSTVFFIGRYSFDIRMLENNPAFQIHYNNVTGRVDVIYIRRRDLQICFLTAHKSKGLQADYVFILNNLNSRMGFPSRIQDAPIVGLLMEGYDDYPDAEERRLFYVALTRAKKKAFLLTEKGRESQFVLQLKKWYEEEMRDPRFICPLCGGKLVRKTGPYGDFYGCSNYRTGNCRCIRNIPVKSGKGAGFRPQASEASKAGNTGR